ncbi:MAG: hypothetical protein WD294_12645 [Phycisphaeraceae bacterium]
MMILPDNTVPGQRHIWFALLGGGVAWALHFLLAYGISEFGCEAGADAWVWLNVSAVAWMILALTVLMLTLAVAATFVAWRLAHPGEAERGPDASPAEAHHRMTRRFAGGLAIWLNGLFTFVIAFQTIPLFFYLGRC